MVLDALWTGFVRLVNVDTLDGAAEGLGGVGWVFIWRRAADGVVEDEDFGGAGAGRTMSASSLMVERRKEKKSNLTPSSRYPQLRDNRCSWSPPHPGMPFPD